MNLSHERLHCPNCPPFKSPSLSVNRALGLYHCFRCGISGKSKKLIRAFRFPQSKNGFEWPDEYRQLFPNGSNSLCHRAAIRYLRKRGLTDDQILNFKIGYCSGGLYRGRVIVPIFKGNHIVYFVARSISKADSKRYLNPPLPKSGVTFKTFIGRAKKAVVVEGVFDAISVSRYLPAIALLSKNPTEEQIKEIAKYADELLIMLDPDALANALEVSQRLSFYTLVRVIRLESKDPGAMDEKELYEVFRQTGT